MTNAILVSQTLPWDPLPGESRRLRILMAIMLILAFLIWLIVPHVEIPKIERAQAEAVPERLAKMVIQQKVTPPPPKPVKEEIKAEEKAPDATKAQEKPAPSVDEATPKPVVTDLQKSAAKARASKAIQEAGIADELAGLISSEVGKLLAECRAEVEKSAKLCHYYADLAPEGPKRGLAEIEPLMPALRHG